MTHKLCLAKYISMIIEETKSIYKIIHSNDYNLFGSTFHWNN